MHLQCGCRDCRQAHEFVASLGGPPLPSPPLAQLYYFANDLAPLGDAAMLMATKLREDGNSTRIQSACCHSILAVDHPAYQANVLMVPSDACRLDAPRVMPMARIYMGDWDEAHDGPPPPEADGVKTYGPIAPSERRPWREAFAADPFEDRPRQGSTLQGLLATLGPATVLGLKEGERIPV